MRLLLPSRSWCAALTLALLVLLSPLSQPELAGASERHTSPVVRAVEQNRRSVVNIQGQKTVGGA